MTENESTPDIPEVQEDATELENIDISAEEFQPVEGAGDETEATIVEKLKAALEESEKRALIATADLENYRKRSAKNTQDQIKYASLPLMAEMLDAVDNLNRAIEAADKDESNSGLLEGVKMVSGQILNVLQSNKCEAIEAVGQPFDPNLHQAVQMQPSDEFPANTVMMEMRIGYRLHERIIRPSQVFVSMGPAEAAKQEDA